MKKQTTKQLKKKLTTPSEYWSQVEVVLYLEKLKKEGKVKVFSAVPNNTYTKSWSQKRKQVTEGVRSGVPDLIIVTERTVLFLEMKKEGTGRLQDSQKEWMGAINHTINVVADVAYGADEAIAIIKQYTN